ATRERADADREYARAVQQYTDQRTVQEHKLSVALNDFGAQLANGTGNINDLNGILSQYGIPDMQGLSDVAGQLYQVDFPALSQSVSDLAVAMDELAKLIDQITHRGTPPGPPGPP